MKDDTQYICSRKGEFAECGGCRHGKAHHAMKLQNGNLCSVHSRSTLNYNWCPPVGPGYDVPCISIHTESNTVEELAAVGCEATP